MEQTLFVTDLDGTLLGPDGVLAGSVAARLHCLQDAGLMITCATARSWLTTCRVLGDFRFTLPVILHNGVFTFDGETGEYVNRQTIPADAVAAVYAVCARTGIPPIVNWLNRDGVERMSWVVGVENDGIRSFWRDRPDDPRSAPADSWSALPLEGVFDINVIGSESEITALASAVARATPMPIAVDAHRDTYHPDEYWLDVRPAGVSKACAVRGLAAYLGVERLVVFGDNHNDLPMFAEADESYAVANAAPDVIAAATGVIDSNVHGGVVTWLESPSRCPLR
jgi:hydroxymethylpyrimidine pyrophosphatase-like HAD family hydrolase